VLLAVWAATALKVIAAVLPLLGSERAGRRKTRRQTGAAAGRHLCRFTICGCQRLERCPDSPVTASVGEFLDVGSSTLCG
jgi:hypothetical protein